MNCCCDHQYYENLRGGGILRAIKHREEPRADDPRDRQTYQPENAPDDRELYKGRAKFPKLPTSIEPGHKRYGGLPKRVAYERYCHGSVGQGRKDSKLMLAHAGFNEVARHIEIDGSHSRHEP